MEKTTCKRCSKIIWINDAYCPYCGSRQKTSITVPPRRFVLILVSVFAVLVFFLAQQGLDSKSTINPIYSIFPNAAYDEFLDNYLEGAKVTRVHTFDISEPELVFHESNASVKNGVVTLFGRNYTGGVEMASALQEGEGILFDFRFPEASYNQDFEFETYFANGQWMTGTYRRFGLYLLQTPESNFWKGKNSLSTIVRGNLSITTDTWYRIFMGVGNDGNLMCVIWNPAKPSENRTYSVKIGETWAGLDWNFLVNGATGKMELDNLMEISFDAFVQ